LQKNIFGPLQMSNSGFDPSQRDVAVGYQTGTGSVARLEENLWVDFAAAGLYSTVEDLYRWDQVLYTTKLVSQKTLDAVFTPYVVVPDSGGLSYGYGWFIFSPAGQRHHLGHPSSINGFLSTFVRYMDDKVTVIILANQGDVDLEPIGTPLEAILFGK
jgi:CubicO group peptidase (beta-lactamase class C family)